LRFVTAFRPRIGRTSVAKFTAMVCVLAIALVVSAPLAAAASKDKPPASEGRDYNPYAFAVLAIFAASITWFVFRGVQRA
jgi:hypothetical protein